MLVLTRKSGEVITIGDNIRVQVVEIKGKQVRLGIDAPRELSIHRQEVYARIRSQEGAEEGLAAPSLHYQHRNSAD